MPRRLAVHESPNAMKPTLLFVHGTGVRGASYSKSFGLIEQAAERHGLPVAVEGCYWGEAEGAQLRAGGRSIPGYEVTGGGKPTEADVLLALWSVLYTDPWYELRLLRHLPPSGEPALFGQEPAPDKLRRALQEFAPSTELRLQLAEAGLSERFDAALADLREAPELEQAIATAPPDPLDHRRAIGRAVLARALVRAEDAGEPPPDGAIRDALVEQLTNELHGYGLGVSEFLLRPVKGIAQRMVTRKLTGDRGSITDAASPVAGDILRFLAHGDGARAFLRQAISDAGPGPVHLLAHSLGGIMCADLLVRAPIPKVTGLITVGSQAPFLYEIGALPGLQHPEPLPDHFPPWLNIYDRSDLLSYVGAEVLGARVTDIEVDNQQPFPQLHSTYWSNPAMWKAMKAVM